MWRKLAVSLILVCAVVALASEPCGPPPYWSYSATATNGPANWSKLKEDWAVCSNGEEQSPIDLRDAVVQPAELTIHYGSLQRTPITPIDFKNTGHYPLVTNSNPENYIEIDHKRYDLTQFHIHVPSEHAVSGKPYAAEIHFVNADADDKNAVVGVFVALSKTANAQLQRVIDATPVGCNTNRTAAVPISALRFLPKTLHYYAYEGSLTTPGCGQGVRWFVLKTPITASAGQIEQLKRRFGVSDRPRQELHGRVIRSDSTN